MHSGNGSHDRPRRSPYPSDGRYVGVTSYGNDATHASHPIPSLPQGQLAYGLHPIPHNSTQTMHTMQLPSARPQSHQDAYNHVSPSNHPNVYNDVCYGSQLSPPNPVFSQNNPLPPIGPCVSAVPPQPYIDGPPQMTRYSVYQSGVPSHGMPYYEEIKGPPYVHGARGQSHPIPVSPSTSRASHSPYTPRTLLPPLTESLEPTLASSSALQAPASQGIFHTPLTDGIVRVPCRWGNCTILLDDVSVAGIKRHLRDHHSAECVDRIRGQRGLCQWSEAGVCNRELDVASFGKHIASVHLKSTAVRCPYCHTTIGRQDSLERHKRDHCPKRPM